MVNQGLRVGDDEWISVERWASRIFRFPMGFFSLLIFIVRRAKAATRMPFLWTQRTRKFKRLFYGGFVFYKHGVRECGGAEIVASQRWCNDDGLRKWCSFYRVAGGFWTSPLIFDVWHFAFKLEILINFVQLKAFMETGRNRFSFEWRLLFQALHFIILPISAIPSAGIIYM